jgi:hypothetical protein
VLNHRARERAKFDIARSLRAIRSDVPIALLCGDQINRLPSSVDACVDTGQPLEKLTAAVRRLLAAKRFDTRFRRLRYHKAESLAADTLWSCAMSNWKFSRQ